MREIYGTCELKFRIREVPAAIGEKKKERSLAGRKGEEARPRKACKTPIDRQADSRVFASQSSKVQSRRVRFTAAEEARRRMRCGAEDEQGKGG